MKRYDKVTPEGTKDYLFDECSRRSRVTGLLKDIFKARGYRRVMTPTIEFYDVQMEPFLLRGSVQRA